MTEDLKIKVSLDLASAKRDVKELQKTLQNATSEFGGVDKATSGVSGNIDAVATSMKAMGAATMAQTAVVASSMNKLQRALARPRSYARNLSEELAGVFNFKNFDVGTSGIKGYLESMKIQMKEAGITAKGLAKSLSPLLASAMKKVSLAAAAVTGVITGLIVGFSHLSESTKEYRQAINQVTSSFTSLGSDTETAAEAYEAFYRVLGDVGRSTEAANLLAQITTAEKDLVTWTNIATGALAMFPDSLPTESLIEASNETIRTGKVVGALADALNWPANSANKISEALKGSVEAQTIFNDAIARGLTVEEAFNELLARTNNTAQRELILRASLNGIYAESARLYEENNKALIAQNEAQNRLNRAMAKLGEITQPLHTAFTNLKATLAEALAPAIKVICDWLVVLVNWLTTAAMWVGAFLAVIFPGAASKISTAFDGASSSIKNVTSGTGSLNDGLEQAQGAAEKLKRSLMGFDELNVVSDMSTSTGAGAGATGGGVDVGGIDVGGIDTGDSIFKKTQEEMEEMKKKIKAFLDEFKTEIGIIAGALGLLGLANMLSHLGQAIGLGEKFLATMNTIKKIAATAITIVLQYTLVNQFMDNYINGEGFKEYLKGLLVAGIGTGLLYAMWGPTGLMIGLGVTAVASIKAVIDNGGIDSVESAVVAITGLASAIGAVVAAVKIFSLGKVIGDVGAFFALIREGNGLMPTLAATFPKLGNAVTSAGKVFTTFGGTVKTVMTTIGTTIGSAFTSITTGLSAFWKGLVSILSSGWKALFSGITGALTAAKAGITAALTAVKTAVSSVISFIIANPIALIIAAIVALVVLIATKGDEIQAALNKVSTWLKKTFCRDWTEVFGPTIGGIMNGFVKIVGDVMGNAKKILDGIINFIRGVFTADWERAWLGIKQIFSGVFGGLAAVAKAPINAIITLVNGALSALTTGFNWVKKQLNKLSIDIPDWVPGVGGETFGFNLSMSTAPKIPLLAAGGIVTGPTLAGIGERGREAVLPLENNTQWMDRLADRLAARTSAPTKVVLKVGERELGYAVIDAINQNTRQTGGLQLQLV